jgi:hypothetical protein
MARPSKTEPIPPVLLTTKETANLLRCAPSSLDVDRCRHRWGVPFLKVGRIVRYDRAAVLKWLADRNVSRVSP